MSNPPLRDWRGKRVWILGASSGIGAAVARAVAQRGARVALSARRREPLEQLAIALPDAIALPCDATRREQIDAACAALQERWAGIDLALYAAGVWHPASAEHGLRTRDIDETIDINLRAPMHFAASVLPLLRAQGRGAIAFVGSVSAYRALPRALLYGASKSALAYFAATLHMELAPAGIGVHLISPGFVATPMTAANDFPMPALMSADAAAQAILAGLAGGAFETHFPKRLSRPLRWARCLPDRIYFPLVRALTGMHR
jgi:NAD(P)-dependent dehydrogenase (short-subunit alcohol dehydrogenase family)